MGRNTSRRIILEGLDMDWSKGFSSRYYVSIVDANTWRDIDELDITGGSISRSDDYLIESASLDFVNYDHTKELWLRIWLDVRQENSSAHLSLFTGLAASPNRNINGNYITNDVTCYSVLKPAEDILLNRGWYINSGVNCGKIIKELLSVSPAPIVVADGIPSLQNPIIAEDKENHLSMVIKILDAINWRIRISGDGTINVIPKSEEPLVYFDGNENDSIENSLSVEYDWFSCPNVCRVVVGDQTETVKDTSEDSILSIPNRGREIWVEDTEGDIAYGESMKDFANRILKYHQRAAFTVKYNRRYFPDLYISDVVRLHYPEQGIDGLFQISSQSIKLSHGATVSEVVNKI